ncbi:MULTISPECIES: hypothetical protein [unclassified Micromonospora]|uniref:hypothetical protein n=1 Tax=unclassified Micromonospora TaxID=2617518 RepID=UPI003A896D47
MARALRRWYGWLLIAAAVLWLGYNVVRRAATGRWHWSILLDAVPPVFLIAVPLLLLGLSAAACGPRRRWAAALALAGLLPGIDQTGVNLHALRPGDRPVPANAVHVVSWNTNYWGMSNEDSQGAAQVPETPRRRRVPAAGACDLGAGHRRGRLPPDPGRRQVAGGVPRLPNRAPQ